VASGLKVGFWYLFLHLWLFVLPALLLLGALGALIAHRGGTDRAEHVRLVLEKHSVRTVGARAARIFFFIIGLELLGMAFRPVVEQYVIRCGAGPIYALNMLSAVLDNAAMAAAEINPMLQMRQLLAILLSLTLSGGMMITGNIPNIVTAGRLKISMKEWLKAGVPVGTALLAVYYAVIFVMVL
jgi:predicted cation transporter